MKAILTTSTITTINAIIARVTLNIARISLAIIALSAMLTLPSCTNADDDMLLTEATAQMHATVTYTLNAPADLVDYVDVKVVYNTNDGKDMRYTFLAPGQTSFTITYDITSFPFQAPVALEFDRPRHAASSTDVDWDLTMDVDVCIHSGAETVNYSNSRTYSLTGNLTSAINYLQQHGNERAYGVNIAKSGAVKFINF